MNGWQKSLAAARELNPGRYGKGKSVTAVEQFVSAGVIALARRLSQRAVEPRRAHMRCDSAAARPRDTKLGELNGARSGPTPTPRQFRVRAGQPATTPARPVSASVLLRQRRGPPLPRAAVAITPRAAQPYSQALQLVKSGRKHRRGTRVQATHRGLPALLLAAPIKSGLLSLA